MHKNCEFYVGVNQGVNAEVWIGIIGSTPGHPILKATIENLPVGPGDNNLDRIMNETGSYHFSRMFLAVAPQCPSGSVVPFPLTFFHPFSAWERHRKDIEGIKREYVKPETMAIHYFATSWQ